MLPSSDKRRGQAMVEYIIVLPLLLMLVLGAIQFALLYQIKSTLNYATFMGARQGALKNGSTRAIKDGLAAGMAPLYTFSPDLGGLAKGRTIAMIEAFNPMATKVEVLNPTSAVFDDFKITDPEGSGADVLPNDNLAYRCKDSNPDNCVGSSGLNVMDANVLKIRVTYCAKMIVPLANATIYALVNGIEGTKNLATEFFATAPKSAKTPNRCSTLADQVNEKLDSLDAAAGYIGMDDLSFLRDFINTLSTTIKDFHVPLLDWGIAGYRIPITAEAVIRMQSPYKP